MLLWWRLVSKIIVKFLIRKSPETIRTSPGMVELSRLCAGGQPSRFHCAHWWGWLLVSSFVYLFICLVIYFPLSKKKYSVIHYGNDYLSLCCLHLCLQALSVSCWFPRETVSPRTTRLLWAATSGKGDSTLLIGVASISTTLSYLRGTITLSSEISFTSGKN